MKTDKNNNKKPNDEAFKMAFTDAVGKCLSQLGFGADVHLGMFDDSKYVEERQKAEAAKPESLAARNRRFKAVLKAIEESTDPATTWHEHMTEITEFKNDEYSGEENYGTLVRAGSKRKKELEQLSALRAGMPEEFNNIGAKQ